MKKFLLFLLILTSSIGLFAEDFYDPNNEFLGKVQFDSTLTFIQQIPKLRIDTATVDSLFADTLIANYVDVDKVNIDTLIVDTLFTDTLIANYAEITKLSNAEVDSNSTHRETLSGNPHQVTQTEVGLGNVDNTSDLDKPISTATQTALDLKLDSLEQDLTPELGGDLDANNKEIENVYRLGVGINNPTSRVHLPIENDAVTPTLQFGTGTGFYSGSTNIMYAASNGAASSGWNSNGIFLGGGGTGNAYISKDITAVAPVFAFVGDYGTGMGRAGANILFFMTNSIERIRITDTTIVIKCDIDMEENYVLNSPTISNLASHGAGMRFNGINAKLTIADAASITDIWENGGAFEFYGSLGAITISDRLLYKGNYNVQIWDTKLVFGAVFSGTNGSWQWGKPTVDTLVHLVISYNASDITNVPCVYYNGILQTLISFIQPTGTFTTDSGTDITLFTEGASYLAGTANMFRFWNREVTEAEAGNFYSEANLDYADIYAGNVYTSDFSGGVDAWGSSNLSTTAPQTIGGESNCLRGILTGGSTIHKFSKQQSHYDRLVWKPYTARFRIQIYIPSGNTAVDGFCFYCGEAFLTGYGESGFGSGCATDTWIEVDVDSDPIGNFDIRVLDGTTQTIDADGDTIYVKYSIIDRLGNVANYDQSGIGSYTWEDISGNGNYATNSGAIPINLSANERTIAIEAVTADETMTDAIPVEYDLSYILVRNETANADTLNFGTTEWGSDLAADQVIPGNTTKRVTINQYFTSETDISISDANGNGWHSTHLIKAIGEYVK